MAWWWSWLLASGNLTVLWLLGSGRRAGWYVGIGFQVFWLMYALVTHQWGFIASACAFALMNWRGLIKSRRNKWHATPYVESRSRCRPDTDQPPTTDGPERGPGSWWPR